MVRIRLEDIAKRFEDTVVLREVNLEIASGELMVILGASGEGKTTLLNVLAGLTEPTAGRIWFNETDITATDVAQRNVAFVFQDYALYPHMTVQENLRFPLENQGWTESAVAAKTQEVLARLHLEEQAGRYPRQLSGGQKQRVALGRALVRDPAVFLFDEPLSNLDPQLRERLRIELKELHRQLGKTFVYVTHDQHSAMTLGDRIAFLDGGRTVQVASPAELYARPRSVRVARFLGTPPINILALGDLARLDPVPPPAGAVRAGLRPEHLQAVLDSEGPWRVDWVQDLGAARFVYFTHGGQTLCARATGSGWDAGMGMRCSVDRKKIMFFDANEITIGLD